MFFFVVLALSLSLFLFLFAVVIMVVSHIARGQIQTSGRVAMSHSRSNFTKFFIVRSCNEPQFHSLRLFFFSFLRERTLKVNEIDLMINDIHLLARKFENVCSVINLFRFILKFCSFFFASVICETVFHVWQTRWNYSK